MASDPVWNLRRARADTLRARHPPAAELLGFYADLLALQESIYGEVLHSSWPTVDVQGARLRLDRLPERQTTWVFDKFIRALPPSATPVLKAIAERLANDRDLRHDLLVTWIGRRPLEEIADGLDCDAAPLEFFPRAFLQPYAEALRVRAGVAATDAKMLTPAACPRCQCRPVAAILRDEPEIKGRKTLLCSLCAAEWAFPRSRCVACGEEAPDRLQSHVAEAWTHIRLEECASCGTYLKTIDLRESGLAVPVVDELASVELDLWAAERNLTKYQPNLFGL
ncbi:MAG: formate dehydrogenase accessory protein FdhE [Acidobacteria bacterium]|nr:formate dehydrogenase accessory protein FdhE [Acidobacteriota bacterium]MYD70633.1 formate dehydrogenase accessory protein FdhE [Acidobacteriota bacterium]MYJ03255.1 formate dehydrogenase accessory protein FdhE [Acidobacteriota bacterium]